MFTTMLEGLFNVSHLLTAFRSRSFPVWSIDIRLWLCRYAPSYALLLVIYPIRFRYGSCVMVYGPLVPKW